MGEIIIVRHGETVWNLEGRQQGHLDSPLTATGLQQAEALANRLSALPFSKLYSSDLGRSWHTAEIIAAKTAHKIESEPRLRERHLGVLQGLTKTRMQEEFPADYLVYKSGAPEQRIREGQSLQEYFTSSVALAEELAARHEKETIVLVTHGGFLSSLFRHVLGLPLVAPRRFKLANGSFNLFGYQNGRWHLQIWGDISHLRGLRSQDDQ
jgi:probable phosphoglycerate mutase